MKNIPRKPKQTKLLGEPVKSEQIKGKFERLQELYALATTKQRQQADFLISILFRELGFAKTEVEAAERPINDTITLANTVLRFPSAYRQVINPPINVEYCFSGALADESLVDVGIWKGDVVVFDTMQAVGNGDIAAIENLALSLTNNSRMIIRIVKFLGGGNVRLESPNPKFKSIETELSKIKLLGRLVRIERDF